MSTLASFYGDVLLFMGELSMLSMQQSEEVLLVHRKGIAKPRCTIQSVWLPAKEVKVHPHIESALLALDQSRRDRAKDMI
jgi:hypothetical protein